MIGAQVSPHSPRRAAARKMTMHGRTRRGMSISGLGQETASQDSAIDNILSTISQAAGAYLQYKTQQDLIDLNIARAQQGLPAISPQSVAPAVNVGVTSDTQKTILMVAGIGAVAVLGFAMMGKRR